MRIGGSLGWAGGTAARPADGGRRPTVGGPPLPLPGLGALRRAGAGDPGDRRGRRRPLLAHVRRPGGGGRLAPRPAGLGDGPPGRPPPAGPRRAGPGGRGPGRGPGPLDRRRRRRDQRRLRRRAALPRPSGAAGRPRLRTRRAGRAVLPGRPAAGRAVLGLRLGRRRRAPRPGTATGLPPAPATRTGTASRTARASTRPPVSSCDGRWPARCWPTSARPANVPAGLRRWAADVRGRTGRLAQGPGRRAAAGHQRGGRGRRLLVPASVPPGQRGRRRRAADPAPTGPSGGGGVRHLGLDDRRRTGPGAGRGRRSPAGGGHRPHRGAGAGRRRRRPHRPTGHVGPPGRAGRRGRAPTWGPASPPPPSCGPGPRSWSCSPTARPRGRPSRPGACGWWWACSAPDRRRPPPGLGP